jgi:hypothetical protein
LGGEAKINKFRLRGGYGYMGSPFLNSVSDQGTQSLSGGIGYKYKSASFDFSLVNQQYTSFYRSYQVLDQNGMNYGPLTQVKHSITSGIITLGVNF